MASERYRKWRDRVVECARKPWLRAEADIIKRLYSVPGFASIRSQVGTLVGLWRREWKRRRRDSDPFPRLPPLRYVQRLRSVGTPLSVLTRGAEAHAKEDTMT